VKDPLPVNVLTRRRSGGQTDGGAEGDRANYYRGQGRELSRLQRTVGENPKAAGAALGRTGLAWALINSPAFLFNH